MKQTTRDNLIYLAVGLTIAALVTADAFYADSRRREMWWPSKFAFRAVTTPGLLAYFVAREMRREKATLLHTLASVLFAILMQLGILFSFRQVVEELPGISYSALAVFEIFLAFLLSIRVALYFKRATSKRYDSKQK
jgi:hydrogenase-4 membrane subunit HyfE